MPKRQVSVQNNDLMRKMGFERFRRKNLLAVVKYFNLFKTQLRSWSERGLRGRGRPRTGTYGSRKMTGAWTGTRTSDQDGLRTKTLNFSFGCRDPWTARLVRILKLRFRDPWTAKFVCIFKFVTAVTSRSSFPAYERFLDLQNDRQNGRMTSCNSQKFE